MFLTKLKQNNFPSSQPHSVLPSLRPGTEIVCHLGSTCRVPLYISPGTAGYVAHHTFPYCQTRERKKEGERDRHADRLTDSDRRRRQSDTHRDKERERALIFLKIFSMHQLTLIARITHTQPHAHSHTSQHADARIHIHARKKRTYNGHSHIHVLTCNGTFKSAVIAQGIRARYLLEKNMKTVYLPHGFSIECSPKFVAGTSDDGLHTLRYRLGP